MGIKALLVITVLAIWLPFTYADYVPSNGTVCNITNIELGYYWVDYNGGDMPPNALRVSDIGLGDSGYVGQVLSTEHKLQPAIIRTNTPHATYTTGIDVITRNNYMKVLCSQFRQFFEWISVNSMTSTDQEGLVPGGASPTNNKFIYFGRTAIVGQIVLGKLYKNDLYVPYNGKVRTFTDNFEVLVYRKPTKSAICSERSKSSRSKPVTININTFKCKKPINIKR